MIYLLDLIAVIFVWTFSSTKNTWRLTLRARKLRDAFQWPSADAPAQGRQDEISQFFIAFNTMLAQLAQLAHERLVQQELAANALAAEA